MQLAPGRKGALFGDICLCLISACLMDLAFCAIVAVLLILLGRQNFCSFWINLSASIMETGPFVTLAACLLLGFVLIVFALVIAGCYAENEKNDTEHTK